MSEPKMPRRETKLVNYHFDFYGNDKNFLPTLDRQYLSTLVVWAQNKIEECQSYGYSDPFLKIEQGHISIFAIRYENDEEYAERLNMIGRISDAVKVTTAAERQKRYEQYLKLKKEFEGNED